MRHPFRHEEHGEHEEHELVLHCAPVPISVTRSRRRVLDHVTSWGLPADTVERLALGVSELAANAIVHGHTEFVLRVRRTERGVRVEASDRSRSRLHEPDPGPRMTSGRGLLLVRRLSDDAGVEDTAAGKRIWFEIFVC